MTPCYFNGSQRISLISFWRKLHLIGEKNQAKEAYL
jgi:hypothetical protein